MSGEASQKSKILCVDDEPRVLDGLRLTLRRFEVLTANGGVAGLAVLRNTPGISVVVSDMRMPGMDGAAFLCKVREQHPDVTRILLTGETAREAAVLAVNEGQIFRFLTKPCPPDKLIPAIEAAVHHHELVTAEKQLLQTTVLGSIRALVDILGIVNPAAFGRASRISRLAVDLAAAAGATPSWELEAAALMSQIGYVSLPTELVEKAQLGEQLNAEERVLIGATPKVTRQLLARIPRLEKVAAILDFAMRAAADENSSPAVTNEGMVLRAVLEFDTLTGRGETAATAVELLLARWRGEEANTLAPLARLLGKIDSGPQIKSMRLREVAPGMILMDDLRTDLGTLLVSRGYEVSHSFIERMRNFGASLLAERVRVQVAGGEAAAAAVSADSTATAPAMVGAATTVIMPALA